MKLGFRFATCGWRFNPGIASPKSIIACVFLCYLIFLSSHAEAAFDDKGGVRPMGMGGAFVALADDTSAILFNPAGLGQIEKAQITASYDKLYAGLGDENLGRGLVGYVQPSDHYGAFAINLNLLDVPLYRETTITFGYGRSLGPLYFGMNAKGLFANFEENDYTRIDPLFIGSDNSSNGFALDLGMLYRLTDSLSFGLAVMNANQPNMALDKDADAKVPLMLQTGVAFKLGSLLPTLDLTYRNKELNDKQDINLHFGIESWLAGESMALRAGANFYDMSVGASYVFSRGRSVEAQLDYAFRYPLMFKEDSIQGTYGTHQFSLNVRFGGVTPKSAEAIAEDFEEIDVESELDESIERLNFYAKEGKYEEGLALGDEIIKVKSPEAMKYQVEVHILLGDMLIEQERYEEAVEHFQAAVDMSPREAKTHYKLGMAYKQRGELTGNESWYNKAIIELEKARMIDPKIGNISAELAALKKR
jgi:tetratricopeptide (TPR) repeat protein